MYIQHQSHNQDARIIGWIDAVGALVFSEVDRPPACAQDVSVGERKSAGRGWAGRGGRGGAGRGGAGGAERKTGYHAEIFEKRNLATVNHLLSSALAQQRMAHQIVHDNRNEPGLEG